jgi:hypothetical protein
MIIDLLLGADQEQTKEYSTKVQVQVPRACNNPILLPRVPIVRLLNLLQTSTPVREYSLTGTLP